MTHINHTVLGYFKACIRPDSPRMALFQRVEEDGHAAFLRRDLHDQMDALDYICAMRQYEGGTSQHGSSELLDMMDLRSIPAIGCAPSISQLSGHTP